MTKDKVRELVMKTGKVASGMRKGYAAITSCMSIKIYEEEPNPNTHMLIVLAGLEYNDKWVEKTTEKVFYDVMYTFYRF